MDWREVSLVLILAVALAALIAPFEVGVALLLGCIGVYLFVLWY